MIKSGLLLLIPLPLVAQVDHFGTFVQEGDAWQYTIPSATPDTAWVLGTFDASTWNVGPGGIGYGDGDDTTVVPQCTSVFLRHMFSIADTAHIAYGLLDIDYDDGFVAFLNGVEIARGGIDPGPVPAFDALADANHEAVLYGNGQPERYVIPEYVLGALIRPDSNVLAIQLHNVAANSSDLSIRPWLTFAIMDTADHGGVPPPSWFVEPVRLDSTLLPLVVISGAGAIPNEPKVTADMRIIYNGPGQYAHVDDPGNVYSGKAGVERRGSESLGYPQSSYGFQLRDAFGVDTNVSILGMPAEHDWVLLGNWNDKSFARNELAFAISQHMGQYAPRMRLAEVVVDDDYKGIYLLGERIKRDAERVAISRIDSLDQSGDALTGGYIWKVDDWSWGNGWISNFSPIDHPELDVRFMGFYPKTADINLQQVAYIRGRVHDMEAAMYSLDFEDPALGYRPQIDVKSFVDFFLVNELARNEEGFNRSRFFHKDRDSIDSRIHAGPVWDFDHGWKNLTTCALFESTDGSGWAHMVNDCAPSTHSPGYYVRLLQDTLFANDVGCAWQQYRGEFLTEAWLDQFVDSIATLVSSAEVRHFGKYPVLGTNAGTPEVEPVPADWAGELAALKTWIGLRLQWLDANLSACTDMAVSELATASEWRLFPVPAHSSCQLTGAVRGPLHAELCDMNGQVVRVIDAPALPMIIGLQGLPAGVFALHVITSDGRRSVHRLIHE